MRLWPLDGTGLMLSFCAYVRVQVVCLCAFHPVLIGRSDLSAPRLPSPQQLERGEPEFSRLAPGVTARTCENLRETRVQLCRAYCDLPLTFKAAPVGITGY